MWQSLAPENQVEFSLPHIKLSGRCWGAKDKPLLLALHGWLDNANSFEPLSEYLTDFQLLAIDWPGHGYSQHRPGHYPLHWVDYLFDLDVLIEHLLPKYGPIRLLGHSLGGIVASAYVAAFPEKIERLVLIEAISPLFEDVMKNKPRLRNSFHGHHRQLKRGTNVSIYDSIDTAINARVKLTGMDEQWCRLLVERNMQSHDIGVSWRSDPRLKLDSPLRLSFEQVDSLMTSIQIPSLLILGNRGFTQLQQALPMARNWFLALTEMMLEGDHHLHMSNANHVAVEIQRFLAYD